MTTIYLTTRDVADLIGVKTTTAVVSLIERGFLPCERRRLLGAKRTAYRPTVQEVAAYLEAHDPVLLPRLIARWPAGFHVPQPAA